MNLFKKIFGKKEEPVSDPSDQIADKEILRKVADELIEVYVKSFAERLENTTSTESTELYRPKHYKIPSVIKTAKAKLKSEGIQSCIDYIHTILNDTEQLHKDQSISLTRNLVKILKSNKHESLNDFDTFLNSCLSKYNVQQDPMFYSSIAEIYSEINPELAINYISQKNIELLGNETFKSLNYHLVIDKIKILIELDSLALAEEEIINANKLIENNTMFQFISDKTKALNLCSQIASKRHNFKSFLKYEIQVFILDTANDLSGYPITLNRFLHSKNLILNGEHGLDYNYLTEDFPEKTISENEFNKLKEEVYQFIYNTLPEKIGIHPSWLEKSYTTEELITTFGNDWYWKFNTITNAPFEHYTFIETFVDKTLGGIY